MNFENVKELQNWAEKFGTSLKGGAVILVSGEMGAGKTTLAAALARGLKIANNVTSPTFSKLNLYDGKPWFMHLDLYNVKSCEEMEELGIYDYLNSPDGVCLIEWWDLFTDFFQMTPSVRIKINKTGNETRNLEIETHKIQIESEFLSKSEDFHG